MKKSTFIFCLLLMIANAAITQVKVTPSGNVTTQNREMPSVSDPRIADIEKRLAALETENNNLKKEIKELKTKIEGISGIFNLAINKLTKDFTSHTHSLNTRVKITGGTSFKPPHLGMPVLFVIGDLKDKEVETGKPILNN